MNIVLLLNNDIASNLALNLLLPILRQHQVSVFLSSKVGGDHSRPQALQALAAFEQRRGFELLKQAKGFKSYQDINHQENIAISTLNHINNDEGQAIISACQPDLIISIRYGVILKAAVIKLAKLAVINLHSGDLPQYRGVMATFWALKNGDKTLTTTLHTIDDDTIDTGQIIAKASITVQKGQSYLWHVLNLYIGGCDLIKQAISRLEQKEVLSFLSRDEQQIDNYFSFPNEKEIAEFISTYGELYQQKAIVEFISALFPS